MFPGRTFATVDHIVPTDDQRRPFADEQAEAMMQAVERNTREHGIRFFGLGSEEQGIVHIIGPELGLTQPGMTIACGDSHTSTHGALGSLAFGIGTSQIRDILATQTLSLTRPKVRRIDVSGALAAGRLGEGPHHPHHRGPGRQRRHRICLRVRGSGDRGPAHGGASHPVQHEHRGGSPGRVRESR